MYILEDTILHHKRFTLLESLIAITIVYIVTTIGLPGSTQTIKSNPLTKSINEPVISLNLVRSIAIKKITPVSARKSDAHYNFPLRETEATSSTTSPSSGN